MALLVRVLRNQIPISISQWVPVCSRLVPLSPTQGQWGRALSGIFQVNPYILKKNMMVMTNNFYAAILGYDEGILSDDHGLAAALWRTFFNQKCEDPRQLELLVEYVRKQIQYLDSMNGEDLLLTGEVSWRPLVEKNPQSVLKPHSPVYNDEGL
uniref:Ubiquinol-cytochrome c reductase complex assembly factor 1 n=1 Tax=Myotis myotis TaxID=51298 RepID=A0A7J7W1M3_MYOMY|nr:ubiquinol-cytochrome c reductase complex assembly factor 1 [Myotis myotis]